jgi:hypothetical protein
LNIPTKTTSLWLSSKWDRGKAILSQSDGYKAFLMTALLFLKINTATKLSLQTIGPIVPIGYIIFDDPADKAG